MAVVRTLVRSELVKINNRISIHDGTLVLLHAAAIRAHACMHLLLLLLLLSVAFHKSNEKDKKMTTTSRYNSERVVTMKESYDYK